MNLIKNISPKSNDSSFNQDSFNIINKYIHSIECQKNLLKQAKQSQAFTNGHYSDDKGCMEYLKPIFTHNESNLWKYKYMYISHKYFLCSS